MSTRGIHKPRGIQTERTRLTIRVPGRIWPRLEEAADRLGIPLATFIVMSGLEKADAIFAKMAIERASTRWRLRLIRAFDKVSQPQRAAKGSPRMKSRGSARRRLGGT